MDSLYKGSVTGHVMEKPMPRVKNWTDADIANARQYLIANGSILVADTDNVMSAVDAMPTAPSEMNGWCDDYLTADGKRKLLQALRQRSSRSSRVAPASTPNNNQMKEWFLGLCVAEGYSPHDASYWFDQNIEGDIQSMLERMVAVFEDEMEMANESGQGN